VGSAGDALPSGVWHRALASAGLPSGSLAKVIISGREVLLARLEDGTVAAASTICPHRGEDLSGGMLYMGAIDCPLHHYLYDLRTGENRYPRNVFPADKLHLLTPLPLYPVKEEEGWILVHFGETTVVDANATPDRGTPQSRCGPACPG
jgi:nitrite reductase/ring-hydroxylating ferredoxin subunit